MAAAGKATNTCGCDTKFPKDHVKGICSDTDCPKCYSCCGPGCTGCITLCKDVEDGVCKCSLCGCECRNDEGVKGSTKKCSESSCQRCKDKCQNVEVGGRCICYLCNCGCNGVNCQCCKRCNPVTTCPGKGKCDTEEKHGDKCPKGQCKQKPGDCSTVNCMCDDMGVRAKHNGECVCKCRCEQKCPRILCADKRGKESTGKPGTCCKSNSDCTCECKCNCNAYGKYYCKDHKANSKGCDISKCNIIFYGIGQCRFKCTNCGRLCDQDRCMNWIRVIVIGLIILASLFVLRAIFPEKFRAIMTKIRATFASSPVHSGRSLNTLVGDTIPEETNIDRYPAFRPRIYAGLA
ncbi:hypothetical protein BBBOND_0109580 [Babesia bigemina]|uniref:Uncharacterized protein n=1 Tax=Babesia bigemina TaxID=5866 RepID=A0A061DA92_BABBI|nr:hypothetical protein BBBOND_0109580 [Babesia bigemina]CDR94660.1 hypothetical protein BBBOND_0109580 [Babesia bigemina]|eukprot:XP_012766846.1 hypothetical protein BBBOND_0109580 [Babesia bigemina]